MAVAAWKWAQQVMRLLGLEYFGTMPGFWLYGGPKALMQHRAVSVMRGAFFEAQQAVRRRLQQPDGRLEASALAIAELMRQHVLWEIERDVFFLSDAFSKGYDFRGASSGRPGNEVDLRQVWGQLIVTVQHRDVAKLIVSLPLVGDDPAKPSMAWCCAVCGNELAMIVATESDKNDEELAINGVVGSENDAVSPACTKCAKCETYYKKMYGMPETNSTTTCSLYGSECTKCTIECDISNCENCSALCERCVPKGNFLNE
jgi:hypothetical protein